MAGNENQDKGILGSLTVDGRLFNLYPENVASEFNFLLQI
jgi:hypothetical protein